MTARSTLGAFTAFALTLTVAGIAQAAPLAGTGENIQPIAHLDIDDSQKNELELAGDYAYVNYDDGLDIVDISDPANPKTVGEIVCKNGGWGDIDISPDANIAVFAAAHPNGTPCKGAGTAATIVDISDKTKPKILSKIDLEDNAVDPFGIVADYVHTVTLDNNMLYLNPQIWAGYPQAEQRIRVFDVSNPTKPVEKGAVQFTEGVNAVAHDQFIDHRPDKRNIMYSASVHTTDVVELSNPWTGEVLQRTTSPEMTISHQAQPNHDRSVLIVDDESAVDVGAPAGAVCGRTGGPGPAAYDIGSVHFYGLEEDGTMSNEGLVELGSWGKPVHRAAKTCTAHVFWPAPDQNRLVNAWYSEGAHVLDFSDPANVKELGSFVADKPTMYWSAKPHRGYIFATDMDRGLDILKYTGDGNAKWPATAGPAEVQRSLWQGVPYKPLAGVSKGGNSLPGATPTTTSASGVTTVSPRGASSAASRSVGRFKFNLKLKAKRGAKLTLTFADAAKKTAGTVKFRKGKAKTTKVSGVAVAGTYRYTVKRGRKVIKRGKLTVKPVAGLSLSPNARLTASAK